MTHREAARAFEIDGVPIGAGRCYVIAEAGVNHNGDLALARTLIDIAIEAGADAVKFQTFDPEAVVSEVAPKAEYQIRNTGTAESQRDMLQRLTLPPSAFAELSARARDRGITFLSTPFDPASAALLIELGVPALKVPSGELTNLPFLRRLAAARRPLLISTGMATLDEVRQAVVTVRDCGARDVALLHCVSSYPAEPASCNLRAMQTMREAFDVPVGWSDHTLGTDVALAAAALGAAVVEKHFTSDRRLEGPDHAASLEPPELRALVDGIRAVESALGSGVKAPTEAELATARLVRRSLHFARDLAAGRTLDDADVIALRPAGGMPPAAVDRVIGRVLRRDVSGGEMIREDVLG